MTPSITGLAGGHFVVTWMSGDPGDSSGTCIRGRVYSANGTAAGSDFIVNSTAAANQTAPSVTALADGRFVVAWTSADTGDGSGTCIRARLFNADGTVAGSDFIVNTTAQGDQLSPSVTALADGRFIISWTSHDASEGYYDPVDGFTTSIRAQIFDPTVFIGSADDEVWHGGSLNDRIYGGFGNDILHGHDGDDILQGDAGNDKLYGGAGNDKLYGGTGHDWLDGGFGIDEMYGGTGDDIFIVRHAADKVFEYANQGYDTVYSTVSYILGAGVHVEELRTGSANGTTAINLTGNAFNQKIVGNAGNNTLDGGGGVNELRGGLGNDSYVVRHASDTIVETAGQGTDTVYATVNYTLASGVHVEQMIAAGSSNLSLRGNGFSQTIIGNAGDNIINGGGGANTLIGGAGKDTFVFNKPIGPANVNTIIDYNVADDTVYLAKSVFTALSTGWLAASAFTVGAAATNALHRIIYDNATGNLFYDADGNGAGAAVQFASVSTGLAMTSGEFIVF